VDSVPEVQFENRDVIVTYASGGERYVRRCSRYLWRRLLEREIRRLNEFEIVEQCDVVELRRHH